MPPEEEAAQEQAEKKKKKPSGALKTIVTLGAILLLSCVAGLVMTKVTVLPRLGSGSGELVGDEEAYGETPEKQERSGAPLFYDPIELIVNIEDKGIDRFLIVEISLQIENEKLRSELASIEPQIKDRFISVLRSKTYDDLKGAKGQDKLKRELAENVNTLLNTGQVVDAFLSKIQIQ